MDDRINRIQDLSSDKIVIQESGYSYQKEYKDENGETQTQTQYVYYSGTMSDDDMKASGYTYVGETVSIANEDGSYTNYYQNIGFTSDAFNAKDFILDNGLIGQCL